VSVRQSKVESAKHAAIMKETIDVSAYPIDMSPFLRLPNCTFDAQGVPVHERPIGYHPTTIAQYGLAHWNQYLATKEDHHRNVFLKQVHWLVEHEVRILDDAGGWPMSFPQPDVQTRGPWLSALTQGSALSLLVRAYQLTYNEVFLEVAHRAVRTFMRDILDGGVNTPIGEKGLFFEEVAVYPAQHILSGFILALFGLYDYVKLTGDIQIEQLIRQSFATMHHLLNEFDVGFWTYTNLTHRRLASPAQLTLQAALLEALGRYSGCAHCSAVALRWRAYQDHIGSRLRYLIASRCAWLNHVFWSRVRTALFSSPQSSQAVRVCIPVTSFPFTGGILTMLEGIAQVTKDRWHIEYMAQIIGPDAAKYVVHRFGTATPPPWHFPLVWLYVLAGMRKLISLQRNGAQYRVIIPQDGVFTAAFAAMAGKLAGVRVVCIDHSTLTWTRNRLYHAERVADVRRKPWHWTFQLFVLFMLKLYWPSLTLLARISARFVDHFLIPGIPGDEVEEVCQLLGIRPSRLTRFASMIDVRRHVLWDAESKVSVREEKGIVVDSIVVAVVGRLAPEKGLEVAMESISLALSMCSPEVRGRVRIVIVGDGPLRRQLEEDILRLGLSQTCVFWGDTPAEEVMSLLGISDIFLYTSTRGACFPMAVLEAMASGCAVIASTQPMSNTRLLAEGRGIAVPPGDVERTALALVQLMGDLERCRRMGNLARDYIAVQHNPAAFMRTLMRATYWSELDELLYAGKKAAAFERGS
jgi:glycosyltransferase involved in cell wall biosynthesis